MGTAGDPRCSPRCSPPWPAPAPGRERERAPAPPAPSDGPPRSRTPTRASTAGTTRAACQSSVLDLSDELDDHRLTDELLLDHTVRRIDAHVQHQRRLRAGDIDPVRLEG